MSIIEDLPELLTVLSLSNERDLDDLPSQVRRKVHFVLVDDLIDVFDACLVEQRVRRAA